MRRHQLTQCRHVPDGVTARFKAALTDVMPRNSSLKADACYASAGIKIYIRISVSRGESRH